MHSRLEIHPTTQLIHGYPVGSDHSLVQLEINIGSGEVRNRPFKWNVSRMREETIDILRERWDRCPRDVVFIFSLSI